MTKCVRSDCSTGAQRGLLKESRVRAGPQKEGEKTEFMWIALKTQMKEEDVKCEC